IAAGIATLSWLALPHPYRVPAALAGCPFLVVGLIAASRQLRAPGAQQVEETLQKAASMSWTEFSTALEAAFRRDGYAVERLAGTSQADFQLVKAGRVSL